MILNSQAETCFGEVGAWMRGVHAMTKIELVRRGHGVQNPGRDFLLFCLTHPTILSNKHADFTGRLWHESMAESANFLPGKGAGN